MKNKENVGGMMTRKESSLEAVDIWAGDFKYSTAVYSLEHDRYQQPSVVVPPMACERREDSHHQFN